MTGRLLVAWAVLLSGSSFALAQAPKEIQSDDLIKLNLGQSKAFDFKDPFGRIDFAPKDIVEGVPQSDRQLTIAPLTSGSTRMFVRDLNGKLVYNAEIVVAPESGRVVKLYGGNKNDDLNAGY